MQGFADHGREAKENQYGHEMEETETELLLQSEPQINQEQSTQHDANGHEQHQIVYFQKYNNGIHYTGIISFNSTLPVDLKSLVEVSNSTSNTHTNNNNVSSNSSKPLWYTGTNIFSPTTLLKNATTETAIEFEGHGIVAHRSQNDTFTIKYDLTISETPNDNATFGEDVD